MAPEVFLHEPYNTSVDVYSFAMICYQLFEACVPFEGVDALSAARQAALNNLRPAFAPLPPSASNKDIREVRKQPFLGGFGAFFGAFMKKYSFEECMQCMHVCMCGVGVMYVFHACRS